MKIRISGFRLVFHKKMDASALCDELVKKNGSKFVFLSHKRILRVLDDGDRLFGSLVTDRGHKNFVAIDTTTDQVTRGTLGKARNFGAFNFFILFKKTNTALVTSYRDAGSPSFVFQVIDDIGTRRLVELRNDAIKKAGPAVSDAVRKKISREHDPPCFEWVETLGREEYAAALAKWKKIRAIEVAFDMQGNGAAFVPFNDEAIDATRMRMTFKRGTVVTRALASVAAVLRGQAADEAETIKVEGDDQWGFTRKVNVVEKVPSLFGELDHDAIIADASSFQEDLVS